MPDHLHLFCSPARADDRGLGDWVEYWKRLAGNHWPTLRGQFEWDFWDTQMRSRGHYGRKLEYVHRNPVRAGLVTQPDLWPYRGRRNALWW